MIDREIQFRGYSPEDRRWYYGDLISIRGDYFINTHKVDEDSVGEYTGIRDIHGEDVYEGDILQVARIIDTNAKENAFVHGAPEPSLYCVFWDLVSWSWEALEDGKYNYKYFVVPDAWIHYQFVVVGNMYENSGDLEVLNREW